MANFRIIRIQGAKNSSEILKNYKELGVRQGSCQLYLEIYKALEPLNPQTLWTN